MSEKKYPEAFGAVTELSTLKVTAEQQSWLDNAKVQIQGAMAGQAKSEAARALGGLLEKKAAK